MDGVKGFNIPVDDMVRAFQFYHTVFGWGIERVEGSGSDFHTVQTTECDERGEPSSPGAINGGLFRRGAQGITGTFLEIRVASIDECIERATKLGGSVVRAKVPLLDIAYFAVIKDSEDNIIGLWEDL
jgi:uncharacterized protein